MLVKEVGVTRRKQTKPLEIHSDIGNMVCKRTIAHKLKKNREDQQANLISNELYHSAKILYRCYIHLNDYSAKK